MTIQELQKEIEGLKRKNNFQLRFPLDVQSKRIIKNTVELPITVRVQGTDAATASNYGIFFVNPLETILRIHSIAEVHQVAGSDAGTVSLQIERLQGTEALDAGDALLSTAFDLKGTANTVQYGTLVSNGELLQLNKGDRLALKDSGVLTAVENVCISIILKLWLKKKL